MNIKQAKDQVRDAVRSYLAKDELGLPRICASAQRPIALFGPPGVGKTAVVEQIAEELGVGFVSYAVTHHTRQSMLGLPFISTESFGGREYRVSEYTMSEILGAVWRAREESGVDEGILFLDEFNCVSETLMPCMLQFLQFKTFGMHELPPGWAVVVAGNPPAYNKGARELDPAMLDRMKRIDVEADLAVWQEYAAAHGVHPAVTTYLDAKPNSFYDVRQTPKGVKVVTARGWEDLSRTVRAYEALGIAVGYETVRQYLQDDHTAREFTQYLELFCRYRGEYRVADILAGTPVPEVCSRARSARLDERLALVGILQDAVQERLSACTLERESLEASRPLVAAAKGDPDPAGCMRRAAGGVPARGFASGREAVALRAASVLESCARACEGAGGSFEAAREEFNAGADRMRRGSKRAAAELDRAYGFLDEAFGPASQEALVMTTRLISDPAAVAFVAANAADCPGYLEANRSLLLGERALGLMREVEAVDFAL